MKKYHIMPLLIFGTLLALNPGNARCNDLQDAKLAVDDDGADFDKQIADTSEKVKEAMRLLRYSKFYKDLYASIDNGQIKEAEQLLSEELKRSPDAERQASYLAAKSKIAFGKGDYASAYAEADKIVIGMEKFFAPKKPYEIKFKTPNTRDGVHGAYILRYQASAYQHHYAEALADIEHALQIQSSADGLIAKMGALMGLNRYAEAARACEKSCKIDKSFFLSSPNKAYYLQVFSEHGYSLKACLQNKSVKK
ncbi:MAG: hypothetical protein WCK75_09880 [Elusimicrobiota bacterium]